jgi:hypothetical protein
MQENVRAERMIIRIILNFAAPVGERSSIEPSVLKGFQRDQGR